MKVFKKITQRILATFLLAVTITAIIPTIPEKCTVLKYFVDDDEADLEPYKEDTIPRT